MPDGEAYKNLATLGQLYEQLLAAGLDRGSSVIALGGGVIGDTAGFAAATYMRGVALVHIPTTLLAQIDSSIGGKVAVDHAGAKNLAGAFYQPKAVIIDPDLLSTLPPTEFRVGMAEVIKHGIIWSPSLFEYLERHGAEPLADVVRQALQVKVEVVLQDPEERGLRAILNFGHTLGHGIEAATDYQVKHGDAVSVGMVAATRMAIAMGLCPPKVESRLVALLRRFGLPIAIDVDPLAVLRATASDKKKREGRLHFVLPKAIGQVIVIDQVPESIVRRALSQATGREVPV
jgi:3-dehydroquinate synthase